MNQLVRWLRACHAALSEATIVPQPDLTDTWKTLYPD